MPKPRYGADISFSGRKYPHSSDGNGNVKVNDNEGHQSSGRDSGVTLWERDPPICRTTFLPKLHPDGTCHDHQLGTQLYVPSTAGSTRPTPGKVNTKFGGRHHIQEIRRKTKKQDIARTRSTSTRTYSNVTPKEQILSILDLFLPVRSTLPVGVLFPGHRPVSPRGASIAPIHVTAWAPDIHTPPLSITTAPTSTQPSLRSISPSHQSNHHLQQTHTNSKRPLSTNPTASFDPSATPSALLEVHAAQIQHLAADTDPHLEATLFLQQLKWNCKEPSLCSSLSARNCQRIFTRDAYCVATQLY